MNKKELKKLGSKTARRGFKNEKDVANKFNDWQNDHEAQKWLSIMNYDTNHIEKVEAVIIKGGYKTDVQVQVTITTKKAIDVENLSIKLISNPRGYNQVDKRWVENYKDMWNMPDDLVQALKLFTGEIPPNKNGVRDKRRMYLDEVPKESKDKILDFFSQNKMLVVSDILKGRGKFSADWMLVAFKGKQKNKWVLKSINQAMNIFSQGKVRISPRKSLKIGRITMQRKGGDAGRETAKMLQFKINPAELFDS